MQTDLWLKETNSYEQCPLCGKLLKRGSQTCYACGFSINPPSTTAVWIDPTVHAYQHVMSAQPAKQPNPTTPLESSPIWQYESEYYEAAGSLPMLSLFMAETPTQPQPQPNVTGKATRRLPAIDEIDTVPPVQLLPERDIDQIDTLLRMRGNAALALVPTSQTVPALRPGGSLSWTTGQASGSPSAQLIVSPAKRKPLQQNVRFNPLDSVRWWLLRKGRIEFMLWLSGTVLLIGVTCLLLLVSAFSFQWFAPFAPAGTIYSSAGTQRDVRSPIVSGPYMALVGTESLVPGQSFQLQGQGFKPSSQVKFYFDNKLPLFDQGGGPASTSTNAQGSFVATLWLGKGPSWQPGEHNISALDAAGRPLATVAVILVANSNSGVANTSPVKASTPGVTHTATPPPVSTPVGKTPVPVTPTPSPSPVSPTPSPTPTTPTPTPTVGTTPTVTPTVKTTPSPTATHTDVTPTPTAANPGLSNALNDSGAPPFAARLTSVSPLVWVMVACYLLSMMFLGIAGVVHKRHHV